MEKNCTIFESTEKEHELKFVTRILFIRPKSFQGNEIFPLKIWLKNNVGIKNEKYLTSSTKVCSINAERLLESQIVVLLVLRSGRGNIYFLIKDIS